MSRKVLAALCMASISGCGLVADLGGDYTADDASVPAARDASTPSDTPDAPTPDAPTPDASTPDTPTPDASTPDTPTPDASTPDTSAVQDPDSAAPPPPCAPTDCQALEATCGQLSNGCAGILDCGVCGNGSSCDNNMCSPGQ